MSVNYKLIKRKHPQKKDEPAKWYAVPNSARPLAQKAMTRAATENTTTAPIELESAMELLAAFIPQQLQQDCRPRRRRLGKQYARRTGGESVGMKTKLAISR